MNRMQQSVTRKYRDFIGKMRGMRSRASGINRDNNRSLNDVKSFIRRALGRSRAAAAGFSGIASLVRLPDCDRNRLINNSARWPNLSLCKSAAWPVAQIAAFALLITVPALADSVGIFIYPGTGTVPSPTANQCWILDSTDDNLKVYKGSGVWDTRTLPHFNLTATVAPTVSNDSTQGYAPGSFWYESTFKGAYICTDASVGAAVWSEISYSINSIDISLPSNTFNTSAGPILGPGGTMVETFKTQLPHTGLFGPSSGSSAGATSWRVLSNADMPLLSAAVGGTGTSMSIAQYDMFIGNNSGGMSNIAVGSEGSMWAVISGQPRWSPNGSVVRFFNVTPTTTAGSTSGNFYSNMPEQGSGYKKYVLVLDTVTDSGKTFTFPTAFAHSPSLTANGTTLTLAAPTTTQVVTPAAVAQSGTITVEGI